MAHINVIDKETNQVVESIGVDDYNIRSVMSELFRERDTSRYNFVMVEYTFSLLEDAQAIVKEL